MSIGMILLLLGALMLCIAAFGGGFEFKGFTIPKINRTSRILGFLVGGFFMGIGILSQNLNGQVPVPFLSGPDMAKSDDKKPEVPPGKTEDLLAKFNDADNAWSNDEIDNDLLLQKYEELAQRDGFNDLSIARIDLVTSRIEQLKASIDQWKQIEDLESENKTLTEKLQGWKNYAQMKRINRRDKQTAVENIKTYENSLRQFASILESNNFLVCTKVVNKNCRSQGEQFSLGSAQAANVWIWAKVKAPAKETIRLQISKAGATQMVRDVSLKVGKSDGYRTYKLNKIKETGQYEARLLNSQNQLIGFKVFSVN